MVELAGYELQQQQLSRLSQTMENARNILQSITEKLRQELFVDAGLLSNANTELRSVAEQQAQICESVNELCNGAPESLADARRLLRDRAAHLQKVAELRLGLSKFQRLTATSEESREALSKAAVRMEELIENPAAGPQLLDSYFTFMDCVERSAGQKSAEELERLALIFGKSLMFDLMLGKITFLPDGAEAAQGDTVSLETARDLTIDADAAPLIKEAGAVLAPEKKIAAEMDSAVEAFVTAEPPAETVMSAAPNKETALADDVAAKADEKRPELADKLAESIPESVTGASLNILDADLVAPAKPQIATSSDDKILKKNWTVRDKKFSAKGFESDLKGSAYIACMLLSVTVRVGALSAKQYERFFSTNANDKKALRGEIGRSLEKLRRKGYLMCYENDSGEAVCYTISPLGCKAFSTKSSREFLSAKADERLPNNVEPPFPDKISETTVRLWLYCVDILPMLKAQWGQERGSGEIIHFPYPKVIYRSCKEGPDITAFPLPLFTDAREDFVPLVTSAAQLTPVLLIGGDHAPIEEWRACFSRTELASRIYFGFIDAEERLQLEAVPQELRGDAPVAPDEKTEPKELKEDSAPNAAEDRTTVAEASGMASLITREQPQIYDAAEQLPEAEKQCPIPAGDVPEKPPRSACSTETPREARRPPMTEAQRDLLLETVWRMLSQGYPECALTLLRSGGTEEDPALARLCRRLAFSLDDPLSAVPCTPGQYEELFDGDFIPAEESIYPYLSAGGLVRLFAWPGNRADYQAWAVKTLPVAQWDCDDFPWSAELKQAVHNWKQFIAETSRGYDERMVRRLCQKSERDRQLERYKRDATNGLDLANKLVHDKYKHPKSQKLIQAFFGSAGDLYKCLYQAAKDGAENREYAQLYCKDFLKSGCTLESPFSPEDVDQAKLAAAMETIWEKIDDSGRRQKNDPFKGHYRAKAENRATELLVYIANWAFWDAGETFDDAQAQERTGKLVSELKKMRAQLSPELARHPAQAAGIFCLTAAVDNLLDKLSEGDDQARNRAMWKRKYFYVDFLRTCWVELNQDYLPLPPSAAEESVLAEDTMAKRVIRHWKTMEETGVCSWDDRLEQILMASDGTQDDYGSGKMICAYLRTMELPTEKRSQEEYERDIEVNLESVIKEADTKRDEFTGDIDLAQNYGQLEQEGQGGDKSAQMLRMVNLRAEKSAKNHNYGFLYRMMDACREQIRKEAARQEKKYEKRCEDLLRNGSLEREWPILSNIRHMIADHKFTVAEEYIGQAVKYGSHELPPVEQAGGKHYLTDFLARYEDLRQRCLDQSGRNLSESFRRMQRERPNRDTRSGLKLAESWPNGGTLDKDRVAELMTQLTFPVENVDPVHGKPREMTVRLKQEFNVSDYPHPIASFGSQAVECGLRVTAIFGNVGEQEIMNAISNATGGNENVLLLLDTQLILPMRRKLAQRIKKESNNAKAKTFLLLDRVLLLYLAAMPQQDRGRALLQCGLPFTYYQPYKAVGRIPPEMFMGRRRELEQIRSFNGPNLVYGGRQLGKTELLYRVQELDDNPGRDSYAVYVEIKGMNAAQAAEAVSRELSHARILAQPCGDWAALYEEIRAFIDKQTYPGRQFRLLIDEADALLKDCQENGFEPIDCLKRLQDYRSGAFKFVLAGLRDVVRFDKTFQSGNSVFGQLRGITIKPMSYYDALELLKVPLHYLGFQIQETELIPLILSRTNYYPGLIQFYCSKLVQSLAEGYKVNGYDERDAPPYYLTEKHIKSILRDKEFLEEIKKKLFITLDVDKEENYYSILAYALAFCYYTGDAEEGYTARDMREACAGIRKIAALTDENLSALLAEMEELNVLLCSDPVSGRYLFNRHSFFHMLGSEDEILSKLESYAESEVAQ